MPRHKVHTSYIDRWGQRQNRLPKGIGFICFFGQKTLIIIHFYILLNNTLYSKKGFVKKEWLFL